MLTLVQDGRIDGLQRWKYIRYTLIFLCYIYYCNYLDYALKELCMFQIWGTAAEPRKHLCKQQNIMGLSQGLLSNLPTSCKRRPAWELTERLAVVKCLCMSLWLKLYNWGYAARWVCNLLPVQDQRLLCTSWYADETCVFFPDYINLNIYLFMWPVQWCCPTFLLKKKDLSKNTVVYLLWELFCL